MAIEWYLCDADPVSRLQLAQAADRMASQLIGDGVLDFSPCLSSAQSLTSSELFSSVIYASCGAFSALVEVEADLTIEDSGEIVEPFTIFGIVESRRTRFSVALGFIVALAWLEQGGGELQGSGLERCYYEDDVDSLIRTFALPVKNEGIKCIESLAREIIGGNTHMGFV